MAIFLQGVPSTNKADRRRKVSSSAVHSQATWALNTEERKEETIGRKSNVANSRARKRSKVFARKSRGFTFRGFIPSTLWNKDQKFVLQSTPSSDTMHIYLLPYFHAWSMRSGE